MTPRFASIPNDDVHQDFGFNALPYSIPSPSSGSPLPHGSYPVPKGGNPEWDIVVTGVLKATPDAVWDAIRDPR